VVVQREQRLDAPALESHLGVVAHFDRALAQQQRQARYDQHDYRHHGRDQKLLIRALQVEPDHGQFRDAGRVMAPEPSPGIVVGPVLAVPAYEHVALAAQRVHAALQVDVQVAVLGDEQLVFARRHAVVRRDRPVAVRVQVGQVRKVGEVSQHVLPQQRPVHTVRGQQLIRPAEHDAHARRDQYVALFFCPHQLLSPQPLTLRRRRLRCR